VTILTAVLLGLVGLLLGSFLNVVVARVPAGESVVRPGSHCPRCGHPVRPRDNVPVLSWLLLRARCRDCREPISARYPLVEAGTALAFAGLALWAGPSWRLPALCWLAAVSIALALIDLDVKRLPDVIVLPGYPVLAVLLTLAALAEHHPSRLLGAAVGGVGMFLLYAVPYLVNPRGMGRGDVKLSGVLGMALGWFGWGQLAVGAFLGFLIGGLVGVVLILAGRARRKTKVPFGPSMLAGAWLALLVGAPLAHVYLSLSGQA